MKGQNIHEILALGQGLLRRANTISSQDWVLASGLSQLDSKLGGGLPLGAVTEWGMPAGVETRRLLLYFLAHTAPLTLWSYSEDLLVYPPRWQYQGVDLKRTFFVQSRHPAKELKAAFIDPLFQLLVMDCPEIFSQADFAFVAHHARRNKQAVVILQPKRLNRPNPLAKLRLESHLQRGQLIVKVLRGGSFLKGTSCEFACESERCLI